MEAKRVGGTASRHQHGTAGGRQHVTRSRGFARHATWLHRRSSCCRASSSDTRPQSNKGGQKEPLPRLGLQDAKGGSSAELVLNRATDAETSGHKWTRGLRKQGSGGVENASMMHELPPAQVAVRNLVEQTRLCHMSTIMSEGQHRRKGYPYGSIVNFASDFSGSPVFALSDLAVHTKNLCTNSRCSVQMQAPGWTVGMSSTKVTLFGDVHPVHPGSLDDAVRLFQDKGDNASVGHNGMKYFVMANIVDVLFVGGFGTVKWIKPKDYHEAVPDEIITQGNFQATLQTLNELYSKRFEEQIFPGCNDAAFISIDKRGVEVRVRRGAEDGVHRVVFRKHAYDLDDACGEVESILNSDKAASG